MTRTDVVASSRPQKADAAPKRKGSARAMRRLVVLPVAFALTMALVLPTAALAAEKRRAVRLQQQTDADDRDLPVERKKHADENDGAGNDGHHTYDGTDG